MADDQISDTGDVPVPPTDSPPNQASTGPSPEPRDLAAVKAPRWRRYLIRGLKVLASVVVLWLLAAYVILPALWKHYEHQPGLEDTPKTTLTSQGIPGDPLNVGLIGEEKVLVHAMLSSGWDPADPVTLRTSSGSPGASCATSRTPMPLSAASFSSGGNKTSPLRSRSEKRLPSAPRPVLEVQGSRPQRRPLRSGPRPTTGVSD